MSDHQKTNQNLHNLVTGDEYLARKNQQFQQQNAPANEQPPRKNPVRLVLIVICAAVFCFSGYHLVRYFSDIHRSRGNTDSLRDIYAGTQTEPAPTAFDNYTQAPVQTTPMPSATPETDLAVETQRKFSDYWPKEYANNPDLVIDESFQKLRQQNRDIVGWLSIEGVLDEPVVQRDNVFYLTHDVSMEKNVTGALFLDESCNLRTLTHNLIVHGHNMKEGAMFGVLKKYKLKDASFYKEHPFIQFNTLYDKSTYVIFAVTEISLTPGEHYYLPFWVYQNFDTERSFSTYVNHLKEYSHFQTSVDVLPGDPLLTLATCTGNSDSERLLVVARKVRDGEDTIQLRRGIFSTTVK